MYHMHINESIREHGEFFALYGYYEAMANE